MIRTYLKTIPIYLGALWQLSCGSTSGSRLGSDQDFLMPPLIERKAQQSLDCSQPDRVKGIWANLRKDYYLDEKEYKEYPDTPKDGGRMQIALTANVTGRLTKVILNGQNLENIYKEDQNEDNDGAEWYHVWPKDIQQGETIWLNFHSRNRYWDRNQAADLIIETDQGVAYSGRFGFSQTSVPITYITTDAARSSFLVHLKNLGDQTDQLKRLMVNGFDVTKTAVLGSRYLQSGEATLIKVPQCQTIALGSAYTVVAEFSSGQTSVGTGRVIPTHFPIEAWNNTSECPFKTGKKENYRSMKEASFDTIYLHSGTCGKCGCDTRTVIENDLASDSDWGAIVTDDIGMNFYPLQNTTGIRAFATGDESDGTIYEKDTGVPRPALKARKSRELWDRYPQTPTFNGGKTNKHIGTFAGMADIQGMDLYVAACAPHITKYLNHPPLRGAYDYLKNTRNNHMPQPTWLYTQGLSPAWKQDPVFSGEKSVQPDPQEIKVQAMSAIAAGAKGLMYFQVNQEAARARPERWQAIADFNRMIKPVAESLRTGDLTGMVDSEGGLIVDMIRSDDKIIIPVISLRTKKEVGDLKCAGALVTGNFPHWIMKDRGADFEFTVPNDVGIKDWYELTPQGAQKPGWNMRMEGRRVIFKDVPLNNDTPVRLFVFDISGS